MALLGLAACGPKGPPRYPDANAKSGGDERREGAVAMPPNKPVVGSVDYDAQDQTDWKVVTLSGKPGLLKLELRWDSGSSELGIDVFDASGLNIASSPATLTPQFKHLLVEIPTTGDYYLRIQALGPHNASVYTLKAIWENEPVAPVRREPVVATPPLPIVAEPVVAEPTPTPGTPTKGKAVLEANCDTGVQGRVVSSYPENGFLVLHLDKGASAGVKVGQTGRILEGRSGESALGVFRVTSVVDETKSVARLKLSAMIKMSAVGKNQRVVICTE